MIFNGIEFSQLRGDDKFWSTPVLEKGSKILLLHDDETHPLPGSRSMKKGRYIVVDVCDSFNKNIKPGKVYELKRDRANAKYTWMYNTVPIDKAMTRGAIVFLAEDLG